MEGKLKLKCKIISLGNITVESNRYKQVSIDITGIKNPLFVTAYACGTASDTFNVILQEMNKVLVYAANGTTITNLMVKLWYQE